VKRVILPLGLERGKGSFLIGLLENFKIFQSIQTQITPSDLVIQIVHENPRLHLGLIQYAPSALFQKMKKSQINTIQLEI
jgi:hypothetical protein